MENSTTVPRTRSRKGRGSRHNIEKTGAPPACSRPRRPRVPTTQVLSAMRTTSCLGFVGPRAEAEEIKQQLGTFLRDELKLELSERKRSSPMPGARPHEFLGYEIMTTRSKRSQSSSTGKERRRSINGRIGLRYHHAVLQKNATATSDKEKRSIERTDQ